MIFIYLKYTFRITPIMLNNGKMLIPETIKKKLHNKY